MDDLSSVKLNPFRAELIRGAKLVGKYDFPLLEQSMSITNRAIPFDKASTAKDRDQWIHFYVDDYRFERIWNDSNRYLSMLKSFQGVISPDFSFYMDMPLAMQIWNTYRNRAIAYWLQRNGIPMIPNVQWGDDKSYDFCFDGIHNGSTVAISTNGGIRSKIDRYCFEKGLDKLIEMKKPSAIIVYSNMPDSLFGKHIENGISFVHIPNYHVTLKNRRISNG